MHFQLRIYEQDVSNNPEENNDEDIIVILTQYIFMFTKHCFARSFRPAISNTIHDSDVSRVKLNFVQFHFCFQPCAQNVHDFRWPAMRHFFFRNSIGGCSVFNVHIRRARENSVVRSISMTTEPMNCMCISFEFWILYQMTNKTKLKRKWKCEHTQPQRQRD